MSAGARPRGGRESNRGRSRRFGMEAPSRAWSPRAGRARARRLGALLLPPRRLGAGDALARSRTAGRGLAADARRGLAGAAAGAADLLHLHHLTPANEAAARGFPALPVLGQLHGTELAMLRQIEAGAPRGWRYAQAWGRRLRAWARRCALLVVPPGAEADAALLLGLERAKLRGLPSGVELERFSRRPFAEEERLALWRRWLVEQPRGWDESGRPGSIAYADEELAPFRAGGPVFLYVGRYTSVKRLPLLISAHARAVARLGRPAPLVLVGGHPGEWEGEHPQALNAADALVLPSVAEAFGLVLVEAMACGLPVIACRAHGPAAIVADGRTGWLIRPDDEEALVDALVTAAIGEEERRARGRRAQIESRRYDQGEIARRFASLYEELLASDPRQRVARGRRA